MNYREAYSLCKKASYTDAITHDFQGENELQTFLLLDKLFRDVKKGKHGLGYFGNGRNEKNRVKDIYIHTGYADLMYTYPEWKKRALLFLKSREPYDDSVLYPVAYHVKTDPAGAASLHLLFLTDFLDRIKDGAIGTKEYKQIYKGQLFLSRILKAVRAYNKKAKSARKLQDKWNSALQSKLLADAKNSGNKANLLQLLQQALKRWQELDTQAHDLYNRTSV